MAGNIGQPVKELAVTEAIARLDKAIEDLNQSASSICDRTMFVRRNEPQDAPINKEGQAPSSVPLVAQLDAFRQRINDIRRGIGCALEQMEI